ncbi:hypothetical protein [Nisaea sediminum]|uniref:hypothetical protein n=1 Tax=Nisaea sediminum TaxID=2775867 RepID=UPI0018673234|nr:hypothetical protein [Nisaea sediminum]
MSERGPLFLNTKCLQAAVMLGLMLQLILAPSLARAEPVALLVSVEGKVADQKLAAFSEIADGMELQLDTGTRVTFLHYRRCEEVTVESGLLTLRAGSYRIVGGDIVARTARGCPKTGEPDASQDVGGVLFRGDDILRLSPKATLIVTGPGAPEIVRADLIRKGSGAPESIELLDHTVDISSLAANLHEGEEFRLELRKRSGLSALRIAVISSLTHGNLAVIRVE